MGGCWRSGGAEAVSGNRKVAVIDNHTLITSSFNRSASAAHQNDEVLLGIHSPLLAAHFTH